MVLAITAPMLTMCVCIEQGIRTLHAPSRTFPLIRHLSCHLTRLLVATPLTPNTVTLLALFPGLAGAACFALGGRGLSVTGAVLLVVYYVLDHSDGELARAKGMMSETGERLDTLVDWVVHSAFFAGLGFGVSHASGQALWLWMGLAAVAGGTINLWLRERRAARSRLSPKAGAEGWEYSAAPDTWRRYLLFAFRELSRADFCFIVLALSLGDLTWVLLPAGAIGAQAYWMAGLVSGADRYHV